MIRYGLDVLYALRVGRRKIKVDLSQLIKQVMVEITELGQGQLTEGDEILYLHTHTVTYQCILREIICQRFCLTPIAAIYRRDGGQQT